MIEHIPFHRPLFTGKESLYLDEAVRQTNIAGNGIFSERCTQILKNLTHSKGIFLTPSCSHALEMATLLSGLQPGDEVITSSFTHPSTANAFVRVGCKITFVDVDPVSMNIDERLIESAITERTKAVVVMHYGGVGCRMEEIKKLTESHGLLLIEDAAHCIGANYNGQPLGTFGHFAAISFHQTKNIHCGEGGALFINDEKYLEKAEIIRDHGTDRAAFLRSKTASYKWLDVGSNYLMNELSAAFLLAQLEALEQVNSERLALWNYYHSLLSPLEKSGKIKLPAPSIKQSHNAHVFFMKCPDNKTRNGLINYLRNNRVTAAFHYQPLHTAPGGKKWGRFYGNDIHVSTESDRLIRLPLFNGLSMQQVEKIVEHIFEFLLKENVETLTDTNVIRN